VRRSRIPQPKAASPRQDSPQLQSLLSPQQSLSPPQAPPEVALQGDERLAPLSDADLGSSINALAPFASPAPAPSPARSRCDRAAEVIFEAVQQQGGAGGATVPTVRVRSFLLQSELLPPSWVPAELDIVLAKHTRRASAISLDQFTDVLAEVALQLLRDGIISVDDATTEAGEPYAWGTRPPRTVVPRASALRALGLVLFPDAMA
jgi:hypothetical protein